ncbi:MAG: DUF6968 family protein [Segniliparus sp.]|uniref:DUF6968 family protein n=1 Tax=Segniliparus sp. TaxID=2804064 RepID=UPI003F41217E
MDDVNLDFDPPMAERVFENEAGGDVVLKLGPPQRFDPEDPDSDWYLPYRIEGLPGEPVRRSFFAGIDSIQVLVLGLATLGDVLRAEPDVRLTFLDDEDLGLPSTYD